MLNNNRCRGFFLALLIAVYSPLTAQSTSAFGPLEPQLTPSVNETWTLARPGDLLLLHNDSKEKAIRYIHAPNDSRAQETELTATVSVQNPGINAGAGIVFDLDDSSRPSYWAFISDGKTVSIYQRNNYGLFLTHKSSLAAIKERKDIQLRVVRRGNLADFYVDRKRLTRVRSETFTGGESGVIVIGKLSAIFKKYNVLSKGQQTPESETSLALLEQPFEGVAEALNASINNWAQSRIAVMPVDIDTAESLPESLNLQSTISSLSDLSMNVLSYDKMTQVATEVMPDQNIPLVFNRTFLQTLAKDHDATHALFVKFQPSENRWLRVTSVMDLMSMKIVHSSGELIPTLAPEVDTTPIDRETDTDIKPDPQPQNDELDPEDTEIVVADDTTGGSDDEFSEEGLIYLGSFLSVFFHEMGHAVIHEFALPAVGPEEDNADEYSAYTFAENLLQDPSEDMKILSKAAAYTWYAQANKSNGSTVPWFSKHSPNLSRFYKTLCFLYGASPETFKGAMDQFEISEDRRTSCVYDYPRKKQSWNQLLRPYRRALGDGSPPGDQSRTAKGGSISVVYGKENKPYSKVMGPVLREMEIFESLAKELNRQYVWTRDMNITVTDCDTINAFYSPAEGKIIMCYELIESFGNDTIELLTGKSPNESPKTDNGDTKLYHDYLVGDWVGELDINSTTKIPVRYHFDTDGNYALSNYYKKQDIRLYEFGTWHVQSVGVDKVTIHHHPTRYVPAQYCGSKGCEDFSLEVRNATFSIIDKQSINVEGSGTLRRRP